MYYWTETRASSKGLTTPITDVAKKQLAQRHRLFYKICRTCGSRNSSNAYRCRRCRGDNLRWKKRELGAK
ncbi:50S ribosomal protein L40e [Candidatus Bathyarchaeota archaeon]|nr:MAG: 50S ribosomal protein L40e [Candidatus Bathyarchaeota archaeon]TMI31108.1 MAG: 50S ribosomal protein L40e [Candidatus Bathyarchaeota archaeon]